MKNSAIIYPHVFPTPFPFWYTKGEVLKNVYCALSHTMNAKLGTDKL